MLYTSFTPHFSFNKVQFVGIIVIPDDQPTDVALNGTGSGGINITPSSTTPAMTPLPSQLLQQAANAATVAQQQQQQPGATMAIQSLMNTNLLNHSNDYSSNQQ